MSTSASQTVYLVTGAARGIGFALVSSLVKRPQTVIFAGVRDVNKADALNALAKDASNLHVVRLESGSVEDAKAVAKTIEETTGKLDVVIANAGISEGYGDVVDVAPAVFERHFQVNTIGPLVLFQAVASLLAKSSRPQFAAISTAPASLTNLMPMRMTAYTLSKAALNFLTLRINEEHEKDNIASYAISPGWTQTDMGNAGARAFGLEEAPVKLEDSVAGILKIVDGATREKTGGKFWDYTGDELSW
ncbi:short-chain dehydrogenase/reductase SDR family protein [Rhodotorula toruloides]|uniref:BY PROTMAP: gi/472584213/gb/EMS21819.1/ short-chain dehydrogenase/reductase SDR family protein [Rhodosporidium toruloides NP11] gi/647394461/emb/CDR35691.1/ RHTO0S01e04984g1_1 [Rhodosporidium torul... n=1 Tax=Rhodotorula toruloides TaxID=5286 RepID=A0A0K3CLX3_RHOTO|nr:short-chain dehydrogenase/reductase SDR family protein [Rhodotorula toruloides]